MSKFNLPNLKNLKWVFGQAFISNNPLLDASKAKDYLFFCPRRFFPQLAIKSFIAKLFKGNGSSFFQNIVSPCTEKKMQ
jgi:hypothetical protein